MTPIFGNNVIVSLLVAADYYPIFCATDMTFSVRQDVVLATSANTGIARKKRLRGLYEFTVTTSGLTKIDNSDGQISFFYLLQESVRGTAQTIKLSFDDEEGNDVEINCEVIIPELSINGPASDWSSASVTFEGTGEFDMQTILPPTPPECEIEDPLYLTLAEGATSISNVLLQATGVEILEVQREGTGYDQVSGSPNNRQFQFIGGAGNGTIVFQNAGNPGGEGVYVLYKIQT